MRASCRLAGLVFAAGCPSHAIDPPAGKDPFACAIGVHDGQPWAPMDGGDAEMTLGFQGFMFIPFRLAAADPPEAPADLQMRLDVDPNGITDGDQPQVTFECGPDRCITGDLMLFLDSGDLGSFVDRAATLTILAQTDDRYCLASAAVTLVDDECDPNMQSCP